MFCASSGLFWRAKVNFHCIMTFLLFTTNTPGVVLNKLLCAEVPPRGPTPYPFIYHFSRKRCPFRLPSILLTFGTPFTYLVQNFASLLTALNELSFKLESITQIECFLGFIKPQNSFVSPTSHFTNPNDRFRYPFIYFNEQNPYPFIY